MSRWPWSSVAITGASGGIGSAMALRLAEPGRLLHLTGRDEHRLAETARLCRERGATVRTRILDLTDAEGARAWVAEIMVGSGPHLLVANAGVTGGLGSDGELETPRAVADILSVNVMGLVNIVTPAAQAMAEGPGGAVILVSSLAGLRGLPSSPGYSASKAAVRSFGQSLRGALRHRGVRVTTVFPGYVKTPLSDQFRGFKPLMMSADQAAERILRAGARDRAEVAFPWPLALGIGILGVLPDGLARYLMSFFRFDVRR